MDEYEEYTKAARGSRTPCRSCGKVGTMTLGTRMRVNPPGTYSLAGVQFKLTGISVSTITCDPELNGCGWTADGKIEGKHFVVNE